jgi:hypothetical protein
MDRTELDWLRTRVNHSEANALVPFRAYHRVNAAAISERAHGFRTCAGHRVDDARRQPAVLRRQSKTMIGVRLNRSRPCDKRTTSTLLFSRSDSGALEVLDFDRRTEDGCQPNPLQLAARGQFAIGDVDQQYALP